MNKKLMVGQTVSIITLFILFDIYTIFSFVRGEMAEDYLDWIRLGAGDYSDIPFFSMYGNFGQLLIVAILVVLLVIFGIILNSKNARKLESKVRFSMPVAVCLINAVIFLIFMDRTSNDWPTWFGHERTAPYAVDGFAKAFAYSNDGYYIEFILETILFLVVTFVSSRINKKNKRKE